jgi:hypothetical protein
MGLPSAWRQPRRGAYTKTEMVIFRYWEYFRNFIEI